MFVTFVLERVSVRGGLLVWVAFGEAGGEGEKGKRREGEKGGGGRTLGGITRFVVLGEVAEVEVF